MILVEIGRRSPGHITGFKATGHSGYAPYGEDIVCAGVSAVTLTAVMGLSEYLKVPVSVNSDDDSGLLECHLGPEAIENESVQAILETMVIGLRAMADEYSGFVRIVDVYE